MEIRQKYRTRGSKNSILYRYRRPLRDQPPLLSVPPRRGRLLTRSQPPASMMNKAVVLMSLLALHVAHVSGTTWSNSAYKTPDCSGDTPGSHVPVPVAVARSGVWIDRIVSLPGRLTRRARHADHRYCNNHNSGDKLRFEQGVSGGVQERLL